MLFCKKFSKIQKVRVQVTPASCQIMYQLKDDNSIRRSRWNVTGDKWKVIMERGQETVIKLVHLTTHTCKSGSFLLIAILCKTARATISAKIVESWTRKVLCTTDIHGNLRFHTPKHRSIIHRVFLWATLYLRLALFCSLCNGVHK